MTGFAFRTLFGAHEPGEPVEASLALMALAAFNGLKREGSPMKGDRERGATVAALVRELGLRHSDAVKRGLAALLEVGAARREADGWWTDDTALAHRARDPRTWLKLDERARRCGIVEVPALFVVALALGQLDERNGHAVLGRTRIAELTDWHGAGPKTAGRPSSRVDRAIRQAVRSGALAVRSRLPGSGLPCYVPGPGGRQGDATNESPTENTVTRRTRAAEADIEQGDATNPLRSRDKPNRVTRRTEQGDATNAVQESGVQDHQERARARVARSETAASDTDGGGCSGSATSSRTETATPSPPATAAEIRDALHQLRDDDRRRELLTDDREQAAKVAELLRLVAFTEAAIDATVAAIVQHRGNDAARWTLDELHDVATDPTADVPALFRWRIGKGSHNPANDPTETDQNRPQPTRTRHLHDGGASIRKANVEAAEQRRAEDPSRLRDVVRGMVTDRKPFDVIVEATGATLTEIEAIAAEIADERTIAEPLLLPRHGEADELTRKADAAQRTVEAFIAKNRKPPPSCVATLRNAGRWPL